MFKNINELIIKFQIKDNVYSVNLIEELSFNNFLDRYKLLNKRVLRNLEIHFIRNPEFCRLNVDVVDKNGLVFCTEYFVDDFNMGIKFSKKLHSLLMSQDEVTFSRLLNLFSRLYITYLLNSENY